MHHECKEKDVHILIFAVQMGLWGIGHYLDGLSPFEAEPLGVRNVSLVAPLLLTFPYP